MSKDTNTKFCPHAHSPRASGKSQPCHHRAAVTFRLKHRACTAWLWASATVPQSPHIQALSKLLNCAVTVLPTCGPATAVTLTNSCQRAEHSRGLALSCMLTWYNALQQQGAIRGETISLQVWGASVVWGLQSPVNTSICRSEQSPPLAALPPRLRAKC